MCRQCREGRAVSPGLEQSEQASSCAHRLRTQAEACVDRLRAEITELEQLQLEASVHSVVEARREERELAPARERLVRERRPATPLSTRVELFQRQIFLFGFAWSFFVAAGFVHVMARWSDTSITGASLTLLLHCVTSAALGWMACSEMNRLGRFPELVDGCVVLLVAASPWVMLVPQGLSEAAPVEGAACSLLVFALGLVPAFAARRRFPDASPAWCFAGCSLSLLAVVVGSVLGTAGALAVTTLGTLALAHRLYATRGRSFLPVAT